MSHSNPPDEPKTISVQLDSQFYNRFLRFTFRTEITKSEAIRMGLTILMDSEEFISSKVKETGKRNQ